MEIKKMYGQNNELEKIVAVANLSPSLTREVLKSCIALYSFNDDSLLANTIVNSFIFLNKEVVWKEIENFI